MATRSKRPKYIIILGDRIKDDKLALIKKRTGDRGFEELKNEKYDKLKYILSCSRIFSHNYETSLYGVYDEIDLTFLAIEYSDALLIISYSKELENAIIEAHKTYSALDDMLTMASNILNTSRRYLASKQRYIIDTKLNIVREIDIIGERIFVKFNDYDMKFSAYLEKFVVLKN